MTRGQSAMHITYSLFGVLVLTGLCATSARAQTAHTANVTSQHHEAERAQTTKATGLVKVIRESTARFRDVSVAEAEDYHLLFGCVSGDDAGAMGLHYANTSLVFDDELDPTRPEIVIYEPTADGRLRLVGADFLILAEKWHAKHPATETPQIMGQLLHLFESPNRFGLPAFYTLHVWAWKDNPKGMFVNWHANVSCDAFRGENP